MVGNVGVDHLVADDHAHHKTDDLPGEKDCADGRALVPKPNLLVEILLASEHKHILAECLQQHFVDVVHAVSWLHFHHANVHDAQRIAESFAVGKIASEVLRAHHEIAVIRKIGAHIERAD